MQTTQTAIEISKSNSSYGRWSVRVSPTVTKFFWRKSEAVAFVESMMSATVDSWSGPAVRRSNEPPVLTPDQVRAVEQRIANWDRKNF